MKNYENKIKQLEAEGKFDEHIMPVNYDYVKQLDENYNHLPKNIFFKLYSGLIRAIVKLFTPLYNVAVYSVRVTGRRNLKGLKKGIVISNHVLTTDYLFSRQVIRKKLYVAGGDFNNKKGFAGLTLKAGGFIPHGNSFTTQKKFGDVVGKILSKNQFILFYPEQALWPKYEKPRPFKRGSFYYAVKNNVPIIPIFICFRNKSANYKQTKKTKVTVKILKPLYINNQLTEREQSEDLRIRAEQSYKKTYEEFYKKTLEYEKISQDSDKN